MTHPVARSLLARARDDVALLRVVLANADVSDAIVGFHAQQAVEKALKSVLDAHEHTFPFTHDLDGLVARCHSHGIQTPTVLTDAADALTPYAVAQRYGDETDNAISREEAMCLATVAVEWAASVVESRP